MSSGVEPLIHVGGVPWAFVGIGREGTVIILQRTSQFDVLLNFLIRLEPDAPQLTAILQVLVACSGQRKQAVIAATGGFVQAGFRLDFDPTLDAPGFVVLIRPDGIRRQVML